MIYGIFQQGLQHQWRYLEIGGYSGDFPLDVEPITQAQLAEYLNSAFGTQLTYREVTSAEFAEDRTAELGPFIGAIIAWIYDGIRLGDYDAPGDYEAVTGRPHQGWGDYFRTLKS